ncbi:class I SAM-dependent methyltransferase [Lysobacter enzymogenes]|uniref:Class I SAM-dependent methyltransferase n=2 Tax=Lysobacter enzymogenes TaxID=69 RepID=A0A3N2RJ98_LYSEN|nr:class I SAM-dependent methyltransferase [Lysobacter enzymogenes]
MRPRALLGQSGHCLDCLDDALRTQFDLIPTDKVSSHDYDDRALALIAEHRDGLVLDCGAGLRNVYYRNVVNCEIVAYDSTDVLAAAERLPFVDGCFDAVLSLNVLEHVKDPFQAARELLRVLKPGGRLMCVAPFLQPLHGYPHHYYNMTRQGLENLFAPLDERRVEIYGAMRPIWSLQWFLSVYHAGLPEDQAARFASMTVAELLAPPQSLQLDPITTALESGACSALASAHALFGRKPLA